MKNFICGILFILATTIFIWRIVLSVQFDQQCGGYLKQAADANTVEFTNIAAGYYVVISSQGTTVMVDSATNPAAEIYEKNTTEIG